MLDPRILEIENLDLFFDVFKKNVKIVREGWEFVGSENEVVSEDI